MKSWEFDGKVFHRRYIGEDVAPCKHLPDRPPMTSPGGLLINLELFHAGLLLLLYFICGFD